MIDTPSPLITIIVPIYNMAEYLDQCLDSLEGQDYANLEIICVNDGSTDGSLEIMRRHAAADSRVVVIDKENRGYGSSCNRGLEEAHGSWVAIVEPDDWVECGLYRTAIEFAFSLDTLPEIVKTPYWRIWMPGAPEQMKLNCPYRGTVRPTKQPCHIADIPTLLDHHPSIWSAIYRKDFIDDHGIRFREIPGAGWADNPFLVETLCQAEHIAYIDEPFYCYREATPEKERLLALNDTLLPLDRWNDMMDVVERLGISDECILRSIYSRGFTYLGGILEWVDLSHDHVREAAVRMFQRMDRDVVLAAPCISPGCKRLFCELLGLPKPRLNPIPYAAKLVERGLYSLKSGGLTFTFRSVKNYLANKRKREGAC